MDQSDDTRSPLTEGQLAKALGVSTKKLYNDRKAGIIPFVPLGSKLVRYYLDEVIEAYRRKRVDDGKPV